MKIISLLNFLRQYGEGFEKERPNAGKVSSSSGKGQCDTEGEAVSKIREESKVQG